MCTLTFCLPGETPSKDDLQESCRSNPDGYGFAVISRDGKSIIVGKDMNAKRCMKWFFRVRRENLNSPALFHARIGTHGVKGVDNCHPFWTGEDKLTVIGHNGVLPVVTMKKKEKETRSDTGIFAEDYASKLVDLIDDVQIFDMMEKFIGVGNKIVVLSIDQRLEFNWYILNEDRGHWQDKKVDGKSVKTIWWSNKNYIKSSVSYNWNGRNVDHAGETFVGQIDCIDGEVAGWRKKDDGKDHKGEVWVEQRGWLNQERFDKLPDWKKNSYLSEVRKLEKEAEAEIAKLKSGTEEAAHPTYEVVEGVVVQSTKLADGSIMIRNYRKSDDGVYRWDDEADDGEVEDEVEGEVIQKYLNCPKCGSELSSYDLLHDYCMHCYLCLECLDDLCTCEVSVRDYMGSGSSCSDRDGLTAEDIRQLANDYDYEVYEARLEMEL